MLRRRLWALILVAAGCGGGTEPNLRPCTVTGAPVTLAVAAYVSIDPTPDSGCTVFPATTGSAAEYLVVPQLASGVPGQLASFRLGGDTLRPASPSAPLGGAVEMSQAERFHQFLRLGDERRNWGLIPEHNPPLPPRASAANPPTQNSLRTFMVCAKTDCSSFAKVGARVRVVKTKVAIYVDTLAPNGGLDSTALDSIGNLFDHRLYAVDTAAFGRESDIDSNTVVLVLMTNTVNKLVTTSECQKTGFVAGFFFGADLDPSFQNDSRSNKGEVFYSIVPDPGGTLSCSHSVTEVQAFVPVTFIHEFQHMISFNQHVLKRGGGGEVLWLNEGFSHFAEELGGRSYEAQPAGQLSDCQIGTTTCRFYAGNLLNAYNYLDSTQKHFLLPTTGIGTLAERGAAWLFVRYIVDRYATSNTQAAWDTLTRKLVETANTGAGNIATVTGDPFPTVVGRWALTQYVTELPSFTAPPELKYTSWLFRPTFQSLNTQRPTLFQKPFPLVPAVSVGRATLITGTLRSGSGVYQRVTQPAGDPGFTLQFTPPGTPLFTASFVPRLNVIRLQ